MSRNTNFHQPDPRRKGNGDGNDGPNPSTGNGDMLKSVNDSNDDGRVDSADFAEESNTAVAVKNAVTAGFNKYYGTDVLGNVGFFDLPSGGGGGGATTFVELNDTPPSYLAAAGYMVVVKGDESGLEFLPVPAAGVTTFTGLSDTPADYTGQAGKIVQVKGDETGLQFVSPPTNSGGQDLTVKTVADTGILPNWASWIADTTGSALSREMPSSPSDGEEVSVIDVNGNAETNNVTLTVNAPTTIVQPLLDKNNQSKKWRYDSVGDVWDLVFNNASADGGGGAAATGASLDQHVTVVTVARLAGEEHITVASILKLI